MEGKKSSQNKILLIFFLALIGLTIVLSSVVAIIFARGEVPTTQGILTTGNIRFISEDRDFLVYLNGELQRVEESLISRIEPGAYNLKISKKGYWDWEKEITLVGGLVEEVGFRLIPAELLYTKAIDNSTDYYTLSRNGDYIYYAIANSTKGNDIGIWRKRISNNNFSIIQESDLVKISDMNSEIASSLKLNKFRLLPNANSTKIIMTLVGELSKDSKIYILNGNSYTSEKNFQLLNEKILYKIAEISWFTNDTLIINSGKFVSEYNTVSNKSNLIFEYLSNTEPNKYSISNETMYFLDSKSILYEYKNGESKQVIVVNKDLPANIIEIYTNIFNSNIIILNTKLGYHYLDRKNTAILKIDLIGDIVSISESGTSVIFRHNNQFSLYSVKENLVSGQFEVSYKKLSIPIIKEEIISMKFINKGNNIAVLLDKGYGYLLDNDGDNPTLVSPDKGCSPSQCTISSVLANIMVNSDNTKLIVAYKKSAANSGFDIFLANLKSN